MESRLALDSFVRFGDRMEEEVATAIYLLMIAVVITAMTLWFKLLDRRRRVRPAINDENAPDEALSVAWRPTPSNRYRK